jgi:hypothetical protein
MRLSILADDNRTSVERSVVGENADRPADVEPPETAEYLFIGPRRDLPDGMSSMQPDWVSSPRPHSQRGWLPPAQTATPVRPRSSRPPPHRSNRRPLPGLPNAGSNAGSDNHPAASSEFCLNSPGLCGPTAPTSLVNGYVTFCEKGRTLCIVANPNSEQ